MQRGGVPRKMEAATLVDGKGVIPAIRKRHHQYSQICVGELAEQVRTPICTPSAAAEFSVSMHCPIMRICPRIVNRSLWSGVPNEGHRIKRLPFVMVPPATL